MSAVERLDQCIKKLELTSDYQLSHKLNVRQARISAIRKGKEKPDIELCFKMADVLGISPAVIIAEIQVENVKNPDKALIFKHFLTTVGLWIILAVIPVSLGLSSNNAQATGKEGKDVCNQHNGTLCEMRLRHFKRLLRGLITDIYDRFVAYFTCNWHVKSATPTC